jgi:hypothetical protein
VVSCSDAMSVRGEIVVFRGFLMCVFWHFFSRTLSGPSSYGWRTGNGKIGSLLTSLYKYYESFS